MIEKSAKHIVENDLNFVTLMETTYCLLRAYIIWIYIKLIKVTKIDRFIKLVNIFMNNVKAKINNNYSQRKQLLQWIKTKLKDPIYVNNFGEDWKDGIALCALMEGIVPGSCPRYDLLNPDNALDNLNLGLSLVKKHLNIDSPIESQEIHDCKEEAKLVYLLSRIKFKSVKLFIKSLIKRPIIQVKDSLGNSNKVFESLFGDEKACFAKGMGLILGVRTRKARFNIFCKPTQKLNLIIEISGPNKTICSEKISVFNPKKRFSADVVTTSVITDYLSRRKSDDILKIPIFYEVFPNRIIITYIPLMKGIHKLSIIWQGQHILNSPYTVKVEDCNLNQLRDSEMMSITSPTKFIPGLQWPIPALGRKDSLSLEDYATVVGRRVLKQSVIKNGREEIIKDFESNSDKFYVKLEKDDNLGEKNPIDKSLDSNQSSNSRKFEKLIINDFNQRQNLFDIKECDSLKSENFSSNDMKEDQKHQSFDPIDNYSKPKEKTQKTEDLSKCLLTNSINQSIEEIDSNDKTIVSNKEAIVSKKSNYKNHNNVNNFSHRSYIPVKNMIQNWEMKLTKNINEIHEKKKNIKSGFKTKIPRILVNNRREMFDKNVFPVSESNSNESNLTISSSSRDENHMSCKHIPKTNEKESQKDKMTEFDKSFEDINQNIDSDKHQVISKTMENESYLISAKSTVVTNVNFYTNTDTFKENLWRTKSLSFPNLRKLNNQLFIEKRMEEIDSSTNDVNHALSLSGQYIDDEIPDYSNLFLGQYVSYTGLLNTKTRIDSNEINFNIFETENDLNKNHILAKELGVYPEKCEVFGAGAYYGQVGVKNHFTVSTKDSGKGYLAVGVQSAEPQNIVEVGFTSIAQNRYEVRYEVSRPGYYVIFVKWADYNIADSPFICKVTY